MKKILFLAIILLFTGCSTKYHLKFNDDKFIEDITFLSASSEEYNLIKKKEFAPVPAFVNTPVNLEEPKKTEGFEYYSLKAKNNNVYMNYKFDITDLKNSYMANMCYDYFRVFESDEDIVISTDKNFRCSLSNYGIDKVDIVITTNHEVLYSNAHEVNDNEYIWHISESNKDNANVQISFSKEVSKSDLEKILGNNSIKIILFGLLLILIGIIFAFIIRIRYKRVNKF